MIKVENYCILLERNSWEMINCQSPNQNQKHCNNQRLCAQNQFLGQLWQMRCSSGLPSLMNAALESAWEQINVAEHLKEMSIFVALASFFCVCKSFFALSYFTFFYIFRRPTCIYKSISVANYWEHANSFDKLQIFDSSKLKSAPGLNLQRAHFILLFHILPAMRCNVMSNCDHTAEELKSFRREWLQVKER